MIGLVLLPFTAFLLIALSWLAGWNRGERGEKLTAIIAMTTMFTALLLVLSLDVYALVYGVSGEIVYGNWFSIGRYHLDIRLYMDAFSQILVTLVLIIATVSLKFSINYMHREDGFQRFFMLLLLFAAAMVMIVSAGSATMLFVGWEMAGISSYLLIGYAYQRENATVNASRAFVTNRIGDAGLLLGIFTLYLWLGDDSWQQMIANSASLSSFHAGIILLGFLLAAMTKSALFPFSGWISRALEGPTPSSALFYGALMVHAGVYLLIRLEPLLLKSPVLMIFVGIIGALTTIYATVCALVQSDIKSRLMFATTAQAGLMVVTIGLGWFELAMVHLIVHAIWRSLQFLSAPSILTLITRPTRPVPQWLKANRFLFTMGMHRFWLDVLGDWLLVIPTRSFARDLQKFDEHIVNKITGLPASLGVISSLAQFQRLQNDGSKERDNNIGQGRGMVGRFVEWLANVLYWFEEQLVLKGGGDGIGRMISGLGHYMQQLDELLSKPRYLLLMIMATFVVIV
jgi:formate hydrogenlyase subunit 3/multisubunit Na+/H+ antiporter MnhD subunit